MFSVFTVEAFTYSFNICGSKKYDLYTRQVIKTKISLFFIRDKHHKVNTGFLVKESYLFFTKTVFISVF